MSSDVVAGGGWSEVERDGVATAAQALAGALGIGYVVAGVAGVALGATDGGRDLAVWLGLLVGGGALVLVGSFLFRPSPFGVLATAIGAVAGALALVWSVVVPVLALALVALSVVRARRAAQGARGAVRA
jgi:hypothetical protein